LVKEKNAYFKNPWYIFELCMMVLYFLHIDNLIPIDPSPLNMIRLLVNLGRVF